MKTTDLKPGSILRGHSCDCENWWLVVNVRQRGATAVHVVFLTSGGILTKQLIGLHDLWDEKRYTIV